ncbi:MAG: winged helix-turn-helix transcriptional regulator [Clostridiaceae bacterium]|nr:winged helix-turn-helix transcriptional regulator [Clostridiaceae bacterium]
MSQELPHDHNHFSEKIIAVMPKEQEFVEAAHLFKQLADGTRLRILWFLCHTEECGINIASAVGKSQAVVSHHLQVLKSDNLITSRREGKEIYYKLASTEHADLIHRIIDSYFSEICPVEEFGLSTDN